MGTENENYKKRAVYCQTFLMVNFYYLMYLNLPIFNGLSMPKGERTFRPKNN